ncbi:MAG TPA: hypothetical protein VHQ65_02740 [Thermoanaerobaculia bacterium]|nr:hypothetical protein [Thermoanaerobaculia bacterium]
MSESIRKQPSGVQPSSIATAVAPDPGPAAGITPELELRRAVWRLLARELSDPSEEFVSFVATRLETRACNGSTPELTRRALQEFAGTRWIVGERQGPRTSGRGRKRAAEQGSLPGYYLG